MQNTGKFDLLPGLASTAWQKGDAGKAQVVDLFQQLHNADEAGAQNLGERVLPPFSLGNSTERGYATTDSA